MERSFRLGEHRIDPSSNAIGEARVDAKAMDVLVALAENAPQVLSSTALLDRVWPKVVVGDNVVHQAIAHLRKALGDRARNPRYIELVPRRGYRLIAPVEREGGSTTSTGVHDNLPSPLTSFVGRVHEIAQLRDLLARHRLVTLTGVGGVGKTRLALVVATEERARHGGGAWLVELASASSHAQIVEAIAGVFKAPEAPGQSQDDSLFAAIGAKDVLLLLDSCEHVVDACARLVQTLLQRAPSIKVLATSLEPLGIAGEHVSRIPPLTSEDAVTLFIDRAHEGQPSFKVTDSNAPTVERICTRLDGLPLAIELAAARVRALTVEQISKRLDDRFRLLVDGRRTTSARQQTLRATLDWSYGLLDAAEQHLLRRLGVFEGGFTLEAAEAVGGSNEPGASPIIDLLTRLMDKSWLHVTTEGDAARYRQLETVKQYVIERLKEAGEEKIARDTHRDYFAQLAACSNAELRGSRQRDAVRTFDAEHENLKAAVAWSSAQRDGKTTLQLVANLWRYWMLRGLATSGRLALEDALASAPQEQETLVASVLLGAGWLARFQGDSSTAQQRLTQSAELHREIGDLAGEAEALMNVANNHIYMGDAAEGERIATRALELARGANDVYVTSYCLQTFGEKCANHGDYARGRELLNEGVALLRKLDHEPNLAFALAKLGNLLLQQGELAPARAALEEAHALHRHIGEGLGIDHTLVRLGWLAHHEGNDEEARVLLEQSLAIADQAGFVPEAALARALLGRLALYRSDMDRAQTLLNDALMRARDVAAHDVHASCLEGLALVANMQGHPEDAVRLLAAAERERERAGRPLEPIESAEHKRLLRALRSALGKEKFRLAWAKSP